MFFPIDTLCLMVGLSATFPGMAITVSDLPAPVMHMASAIVSSRGEQQLPNQWVYGVPEFSTLLYVLRSEDHGVPKRATMPVVRLM